MQTVQTSCYLAKQWHHAPLELRRLSCFEHFLQLVQKHDFFGTIRHWPVLQQPSYNRVSKFAILFYKLRDTIRQLLMVHLQAFGFVERYQNPNEEHFVLVFQGESKPIDDASQDFKKLSNPVVFLRLENKPVEDIVYGLPDERAVNHKLTVDPMENGFKTISFSGILGIKQVQQPQDERLVNVSLSQLGVSLRGSNEPQEKLIHRLQVRPRKIHGRLFLLQV